MKQYVVRMLSAVAGLFLFSAQSAQAQAPVVDSSVAYSYEFEDDPLAATGEVAAGLRIEVRPRGMRSVLLRPRTQFIAELLKTAEDL